MSSTSQFDRHLAAWVLATCACAAVAAPLSPLTYAMPNGDGQAHGGTFNYWDANYSGSGLTTTDGAPLSAGLGKLTDGVVSIQRWDAVSNNAGTGEYVGWLAAGALNPLITFDFGVDVLIQEISIQLDNSNFGGVFAPAEILIDGVSLPFTPPADFTVGTVSLSGLALTGAQHTVQFKQDGQTWTFVSEISFDGSVIPEPGALALALAALASLGLARRSVR